MWVDVRKGKKRFWGEGGMKIFVAVILFGTRVIHLLHVELHIYLQSNDIAYVVEVADLKFSTVLSSLGAVIGMSSMRGKSALGSEGSGGKCDPEVLACAKETMLKKSISRLSFQQVLLEHNGTKPPSPHFPRIFPVHWPNRNVAR